MALAVAVWEKRVDSKLEVGLHEIPEIAIRRCGLSRFAENPHLQFFLVFFLFLIFYALTAAEKTNFNEHVRLADALLHGHAWVEPPPSYMERANYGGRSYIVHPPLPAFLMIPLVAIFGPSLNQTMVSVLVGAFSVALVWKLCGLIAKESQVWLTIFFGVGTTFWYEATLGDSWNFAVVMSVPATLLALNELFGKARPFVVGCWAGVAALARYDLVLVWPFYLALLWARGQSWRSFRAVGGFAIAMAVSVWFNEIRFGTLNDISIFLFTQHDNWLQQRMGGGAPLQLRFLPANLYALLFMAPSLNDTFPYIHPQMQGQALILTSPAFLLALKPNFRRALPLLILLAAGFSMGPVLLWYGNGFMQFGMRFYVQSFPFLMVLIALGAKEQGIDQMGRILIVISMVLVAYGTWHIRTLGFG
jgi:hypothetical protein